MSELILTGKTEAHLQLLSDGSSRMHRGAVAAFEKMRESASGAGVELRICSSFRGFEKQLQIWNEKVLGKRPVLDVQGKPLDRTGLTRQELLSAILRWSAVPGASRHHWGTDIDVFDAEATPPGYQLQLTAEEYDESGIFSRLSHWIDAEASQFGFFKPYQRELGGVQPEPWHLSYAPLSVDFEEAYTLELFRKTVTVEDCGPLELKAELLERLEFIYENYIRGVERPG